MDHGTSNQMDVSGSDSGSFNDHFNNDGLIPNAGGYGYGFDQRNFGDTDPGFWGMRGEIMMPIMAALMGFSMMMCMVMADKYVMKEERRNRGGPGFSTRSSAETSPVDPKIINELSAFILPAIIGQDCPDRLMCVLGSIARERNGIPALDKYFETTTPAFLKGPIQVLKSSAESSTDCAKVYPCHQTQSQNQSQVVQENSPGKIPDLPSQLS